MKKTWKFGKQSLTQEDVEDILTTAIEGGIGYWACLDCTDEEWVKSREAVRARLSDTPCYCDVAFDVLENGKAVRFADECDGNKPLALTKENFLAGCEMFAKGRKVDLHRYIQNSSFDAIDADCIIQYALFGELMYN